MLTDSRFFYSLFLSGCLLYSIYLLSSVVGCGDSHDIICKWSEKHSSCFCRDGPRKGYTLTWAPAEVCRK